jgi:uncharacterized protein (TIGR02996 family)
MDTEEAFWKSIGEVPEDQLRRLVFADWCQENGRDDLAVALRAACDRVPLLHPHARWSWTLLVRGVHGQPHSVRRVVFVHLTGMVPSDWPSWRDYGSPVAAIRDLCRAYTLAMQGEPTGATP